MTLKNSQVCAVSEDDFIASVIGKPWVNRAADMAQMDCWGLVVLYYRHACGRDIYIPSGYGSGAEFAGCFDEIMPYWTEVSLPSDGVMVTGYYGDHPVHVGIVVGDKVLHSRGENGCVTLDRLITLKRLYTRIEYYEYSGN